jgi:hypothetical protein
MLLTISILCTVVSGVGALKGHVEALLLFPSALIALEAHFRFRELEKRLSETRPLSSSQSDAETLDWVPMRPSDEVHLVWTARCPRPSPQRMSWFFRVWSLSRLGCCDVAQFERAGCDRDPMRHMPSAAALAVNCLNVRGPSRRRDGLFFRPNGGQSSFRRFFRPLSRIFIVSRLH